jgi:hypothetical protein
MSMLNCSLFSLGCVAGFAPPAEHTSLTALRALKIAQRRLRPEVRAKLLSATSARSDNSLNPRAWRFFFADPGTSGRCRVVTVAAKNSSEHPDTVEAFASSRPEDASDAPAVPQNKLAVDSDCVAEKIRAASKLKGVRGAEFQLLQPKGKAEPCWLVKVYNEKDETVASFRIGAKTGALELVTGAA